MRIDCCTILTLEGILFIYSNLYFKNVFMFCTCGFSPSFVVLIRIYLITKSHAWLDMHVSLAAAYVLAIFVFKLSYAKSVHVYLLCRSILRRIQALLKSHVFLKINPRMFADGKPRK